MTLPAVNGWLIDFRTARAIFESQSNERIAHCVDACANGSMHYCHEERDLFKGVPNLKSAFVDQANCVCTPDQEILEICLHVARLPLAKKLMVGNNSAIFLTATAAVKKYGIISDHRNLVLTTVYDLCKAYGIPSFSANEYFERLG